MVHPRLHRIIFMFILISISNEMFADGFQMKSIADAEKLEKNMYKIPAKIRPSIKLSIAKMYVDSDKYPEKVISYTREFLGQDYDQESGPYRLRSLNAHHILGTLYTTYLNFESANKEFEKAYNLLRPWDKYELRCQVLLSMAHNNKNRNKIEASNKHLAEAYDIAKRMNLVPMLTKIFQFHTDFALKENQIDTIEYYQFKTINISNDQYALSSAFMHLAMVEKERRNFVKARRYSEQSLQHALNTNDKVRIGDCYSNLAFYSALNNDFEFANESLVKAWGHLSEDWNNNLKELRDCSFTAGVIASLEGDYRLGFAHLRAYVDFTLEMEEATAKAQQVLIANQSTLIDRENEINLLLLNKKLESENQKKIQLRHWFIVIVLLTLIIISVYIIFNMRERASNQAIIERQSIELTQKKFNEEIQKMEFKAMTANLEGQEFERERIAKELHDGVGGAIAGIKLELESIFETETNIHRLRDILSSITNIYDEVRFISRNLSVPGFENSNFKDNIKSLIEDFRHQNNLQILFHIFPEKNWPEISYNTQKEIYRITQESLTNISKHAEATQVQVQFILDKNTLKGSIEDNGKGFNKNERKNGLGLKNMASRIQSLKGELNIDTGINQGTFVEFSIPLNQENKERKTVL